MWSKSNSTYCPFNAKDDLIYFSLIAYMRVRRKWSLSWFRRNLKIIQISIEISTKFVTSSCTKGKHEIKFLADTSSWGKIVHSVILEKALFSKICDSCRPIFYCYLNLIIQQWWSFLCHISWWGYRVYIVKSKTGCSKMPIRWVLSHGRVCVNIFPLITKFHYYEFHISKANA